jgi:hypothetical protein
MKRKTIVYVWSYRKVPGLGQKRNAGLTYSILAAISLKIFLGTYTVIPLFFPCFRSTMEVILLNAVEYHLWFPLDVRHCFKMSSLQFHFQFGKQIQLLLPIMILEIKVGSLLAFSRSSWHMFTCCCFWSFVKSWGTNFAAMWRMFNFLLRSPSKLHNWSQRSLQAYELFSSGLRGWVLEFFQHFLLFCWCLVALNIRHLKLTLDRPW